MRGDAFAPHLLAADIGIVHDLFAHFFATLSPADWQRPTETNGWSLHETIAHLDAAAWAYQQTIEAILNKKPFDFATIGIHRRQDLPAWNAAQIALRQQRPLPDLCASFLGILQTAATSAASCQPNDLQQTYPFPAYNRDITLAELYGGQATHPGLVHAAQVAHGANVPPLWRQYDLAALRRQLTRLLHLAALSYWPEQGKLQTTVNFVVPRQASWHFHLSLHGCEVAEGTGKRPSLTIWFRNLDVLCRILTLQIRPVRAALTGQAFVWGCKPLLAFQLEHLFNPTGVW